jgi:hypothetical protein
MLIIVNLLVIMIGPLSFLLLTEKNRMQTILFMGGGGANTYIKNVFL